MMGIERGLFKTWNREKAEAQEQERLRRKHNIPDETVKVVEKSSVGTIYKTSVNVAKSLIKTILQLFIFLMATIGVLCLIYPDTRAAAIEVFNGLLQQVKDFF